MSKNTENAKVVIHHTKETAVHAVETGRSLFGAMWAMIKFIPLAIVFWAIGVVGDYFGFYAKNLALLQWGKSFLQGVTG